MWDDINWNQSSVNLSSGINGIIIVFFINYLRSKHICWELLLLGLYVYRRCPAWSFARVARDSQLWSSSAVAWTSRGHKFIAPDPDFVLLLNFAVIIKSAFRCVARPHSILLFHWLQIIKYGISIDVTFSVPRGPSVIISLIYTFLEQLYRKIICSKMYEM